MHIVLFGGQADSLSIYRENLIRTLVSKGHRVTAVAGSPTEAVTEKVKSWGADFQAIPLKRAGLNPFSDLRAFVVLLSLLRRLKPDALLAYQFKPVVLGMIAARLAGVRNRNAMIPGLGYAFVDESSRALARVVAIAGYWAALRLARRVIFQNEEDRTELVNLGLCRRENTARVAGSGVDLTRYALTPVPSGPAVFVMITRLLQDKGVREFVDVARRMRREGLAASFVLVGPYDPNPTSITPPEVEAWQAEGVISYEGAVDDVRPYLRRATVFVLPSYYREGVPRTLLEAMAMGRPVITTDMPGCRDTVPAGENGVLIPPRDVDALHEQMVRFATGQVDLDEMGRKGRALAGAVFDADKVSLMIHDVVCG